MSSVYHSATSVASARDSPAKLMKEKGTCKLSRHKFAVRSNYSPYRFRDYIKRSRTRTPSASAIVCNLHSDGSF